MSGDYIKVYKQALVIMRYYHRGTFSDWSTGAVKSFNITTI